MSEKELKKMAEKLRSKVISFVAYYPPDRVGMCLLCKAPSYVTDMKVCPCGSPLYFTVNEIKKRWLDTPKEDSTQILTQI